MTISAPQLQIKGAVAGYTPAQQILKGVDIAAAPGKITVVLGPNGTGKSTLLKLVAGFVKASEGDVLLNGKNLNALPVHERLGEGIGLLPQGRSAFPDLTVEENIELGGWSLRSDRKRLREAVEAMFVRYPHLEKLRDRRAGTLSGGQQRAVEIARMLVSNPSVLLIDEPSVGLSPIVATQVYKELVELRDEGRTILLVDQDVRAAIKISDYVYVLTSGKNDIQGDRTAFEGDLGSIVRGWLGV
ncbi:MAG: ABC transporter ATP-binding protein [Bradyrhizobiaceae bacterium]|nr:ABC transporter ATP-binding protein [Bradyrhizobiaceae bacterium]